MQQQISVITSASRIWCGLADHPEGYVTFGKS